MRNIIFIAAMLVATIANGQAVDDLVGRRIVPTGIKISIDSAGEVYALRDYILVDPNGDVHIYGDTMQAIRRLYKEELEAWEEANRWQGRYFHLMDRIKNLK